MLEGPERRLARQHCPGFCAEHRQGAEAIFPYSQPGSGALTCGNVSCEGRVFFRALREVEELPFRSRQFLSKRGKELIDQRLVRSRGVSFCVVFGAYRSLRSSCPLRTAGPVSPHFSVPPVRTFNTTRAGSSRKVPALTVRDRVPDSRSTGLWSGRRFQFAPVAFPTCPSRSRCKYQVGCPGFDFRHSGYCCQRFLSHRHMR